MPFLSSFGEHYPQSLIFNNFFAASNQTVKSQFALSCGIYPTYNGKVATDYLDLKVNCLPRILKSYGYSSEATNAVGEHFHNHYHFSKIQSRWEQNIH